MKKILFLLVPSVFCLFLSNAALSAAWAASVGSMERARGSVTLLRKGERVQAAQGAPLHIGDTILTGKQPSYTLLRFINGAKIELREKSRFVITAYSFRKKRRSFLFQLLEGLLKGNIPQSEKGEEDETRFKTPTAVIGIRGTIFVIEAGAAQTSLYCFKGVTEIRNPLFPKQRVVVKEGFFSEVRRGALPIRPKKIPKSKRKKFGFGNYGMDLEELETPPDPPKITLPPPTSPTTPTTTTTPATGTGP